MHARHIENFHEDVKESTCKETQDAGALSACPAPVDTVKDTFEHDEHEHGHVVQHHQEHVAHVLSGVWTIVHRFLMHLQSCSFIYSGDDFIETQKHQGMADRQSL